MTDMKVALVTAGGSGMGADAARRLAADGFKLAILSSSGKGEALAVERGGVGVTGSNLSGDDLQALVDLAMNNWGRFDVLVNSAGHGPKGPVLEISDDDWHMGMETYLMNVVRPTRLVTPIMAAQAGDRSSISPPSPRLSPIRCFLPLVFFARRWRGSPSSSPTNTPAITFA
jgi:NAD(P)-dependent dehydrogenase (short-subunit alcohol dehydrogenase family)